MQIALVSDIHSNLQALEAVLKDIDDRGIDEIWCLGDVVGYGADPDACSALVEDRCEICLAGNHDLVVRGDLPFEEFSRAARDAARWTAEEIVEETRAFLAKLSPHRLHSDFGLYHASPRDPVWEYVLSTVQAEECMNAQERRVCFVGHSHVACHFSTGKGDTTGNLAPAGHALQLAEDRWLINPGSVGQPRDGDARAAYLMLDTTKSLATFQRVEYPIAEAARAIVDARLPLQLAERLFSGL